MLKKKIVYVLALTMFVMSFFMPSCKKQEFTLATTSDVNIVGYLDKFPDTFSLFRKILERTEYDAFLNAYGSYTVFAPTNTGVKAWLAKINVASVEAADLNVLKDMVKFHLLGDTLSSSSFKDGKIAVPTMYGQYLVAGVLNASGNSSILINRQGIVEQPNIRVGNGYIHVVNNVLMPSVQTIAQQLEAKPEYSVFVQAMKETGFYTMLNTVNADSTKRWMTVIAESNKALQDSGFADYAALKARYSKTGNPANTNDSLYIYMAYHIITGIKFLGDIITTSTHITMQPQEVINAQLMDTNVVLNEVEINSILEKGVVLNRQKSDNAATNGVWHDSKAHFAVKFRLPTALFWDVSTFPEIRKLPAFYKKQNKDFVRNSEAEIPIADIPWGWGSLAGTNVLSYIYSTSSSITNYAYNNDVNMLPLGLPSRPIYWEMITPPIVKGKYKIWICYRQQKQSSSSNELCMVSVNGTDLQRTMNFTETRPAGTDTELEVLGWKRYTENTTNIFAAKNVGIYEFKTTQRHRIRITPLVGTQNNNNLDMIHFIPIDQNQILPRFRPDGTKIYL